MKQILLLTRSLKKGGAEKQCLLTAIALKNHYNITVVVQYEDEPSLDYIELIKRQSLHVITLRGSIYRKSIFFFSYLKKKQVSCIFAYLASGNVFAGVIGRLAGVKKIWGGIRNCLLDRKKMMIQRFFHNHILTGSIFNNFSGFENMLAIGFNKEKSIVIQNCIVLNNEQIIREKKEKITILSVSRFVVQKDICTILTALKKLLFFRKNFHYILIGYGPQENEIKKEIKCMGIESYVSLIINPENVEKYYKEADVFVSSSLFEGLSNSIMEAMNFSLPIIATDVGDNHYLVKEGENGYLVPVKDPQAIMERLTMLIDSYQKRNELGNKSYQIISTEFSLEKLKNRYIDLIENNK